MRPVADAAPAPARNSAGRAVERLRLAAVVLGLWLVTFAQSSGLASADTKLDLVVSPARFLRQALSMWDPTAASGQMQDQAYGYLFPIGPAFLIGKLAALPAWMVQRSWESLLMTVAFLGVVRLARLLGVRGFAPQVGAGLAYALSPRMLSELTVISAELLPMAVLPWVMIPLVRGSTAGSPRRAAARSGIAFAFVSGVNASASIAILPVPALWLLTRSRGPRRRSLMTWWVVAIVLASTWWVVPLLVLGKYSPPFLDWIESSSVTTRVTDLVDVLRGTDHWQAFLGPGEWPGGWILVAAPAAILATTAVAAMGFVGVGRRATPHRGFLLACVALGVVLLGLGHAATIGPPFGASVRTMLNGSLAAFRNVHKFDPVLRLPLAIGVGHTLAVLAARTPRTAEVHLLGQRFAVFPRAIAAIAVLGIAAVATGPALGRDLVTRSRSVNDPTWWSQTGQWLGHHDAGGRALVVPGAAQPTYLWGSPRDDALQPVADGPWAVRDAAPLGQAGYVRLLDAVEALLATGRPQPSLAPLLARAGIGYLVVRNDLDTQRSGATALRYLHATVDSSPGWSQVAAFGDVFTGRHDPARVVDQGLITSNYAVQVYANADATGRVGLLPATNAVAATGSADVLPGLVADGLQAQTPVLFGTAARAVIAAGIPVHTVATDGIRRREYRFGGVDQYSATMTTAQAFAQQRKVHDYLPADAGPLSTYAYDGIADVRASTSAANAAAFYLSPAAGPWAALDDDPQTAWRSASFTAVGQWLQVDLANPTDVGTVQLAFATGSGPLPSRIRVTTDAGSIDQAVAPADVLQPVQVRPGATQSLRITVLAMADGSRGSRVAIAALQMSGVQPTRTLDVPTSGVPDILHFAVAPGERPACLTLASGAAACDATWAAPGEEDGSLDRTVTLPVPTQYGVGADVRFVPGPRLDALLDFGNPLRAIASSDNSDDPRERPGAALDGNLQTGWVAEPGDRQPTLAVSMPKPVTVRTVTVLPIRAAPVTSATRVLIVAGSEVFAADVPRDGVIALPTPVRTRSVRVTVLASTLRVSTDSLTGVARQLPVGIGELRLGGTGAPVATPPTTVSVGCGAASVVAGAGTVPLKVVAPAADLLAGRVIAAEACGTAQMHSGANDIRLTRNALLAPVAVTLARVGVALSNTASGEGTVQVRTWGSTSRSVQVATTAPALLVVHENANAGWRASLAGHALTPIMVDGWQQAWLVPGGSSGVVSLTFTPQRKVDVGLLGGALAIVLLCIAATVRPRRPDPAPIVDGVVGRRLVQGLGVLALAAMGSVVGAGIAVLAIVVIERVIRRSVPAWLPAGLLLAAGLGQAIGPPASGHPLSNSNGVQILCLLALSLLVVTAAAPRSAQPAQQGSLDESPGRGRHRGRRGSGEEVQSPEVPAELGPAEPPLNREQQAEVPEVDAVGDLTEPPSDPAAEGAVDPAVRPEDDG